MDLLNAVRQQLSEHDMLVGSDTLICALSGGADSVCLAHVLWKLSQSLEIEFACAHFNHQLRGEESDRDAEFVGEWCRERQIPLFQGCGDVRQYANIRHLGIEEAARILRYEFLDKLGDDRTRIATAHHADDAAETILMNLLRGSGLKGLCGIPPVRGRYIRPLLNVSREEIMEYLSQNELTHVEDSSNGEDDCRRNILRHRVLPVLRELNPSFSKACARTGEILRQDDACLQKQANDLLNRQGDTVILYVDTLLSLPPSVGCRAIRLAAEEFRISLTKAHTDAVYDLCRSKPSAETNLPNGIKVYRVYGELRFVRSQTIPEWEKVDLPYNVWVQPEGLPWVFFAGDLSELRKVHGKFTSWFFKKEETCGMIQVRPRMTGDRLRLPGREGSKTLKKWMIELRIPAKTRNTIPVISDDRGALAVPGIGIDARAAAEEKEADAVIIILERT